MRGGRARLTAKARDDLTPRQREVMELLAAGRTNFEIAEALGITLEGAKYHVSEILAKLSVESREEAVAAWRGDQSHPWRRVLVGIGASVAATIAAVAVVLAHTGDSDAPATPLEPGVWLAWVPNHSEDGKYPLQILRSSEPDKPVRVFDDQLYALPAWSPDARYLAVTAASPSDRTRDLVLIATGDWSKRNLMPDDGLGSAKFWSPDSSTLLLLNPASGAKFIDIPAGTRKDVNGILTGNALSSTTAAWSPDGTRIAVMLRGKLSVITHSSIEQVAMPAGDFADHSPFSLLGRAGLYWTGTDSFITVAGPPGENGFSLAEMHRWTFERRDGTWQVVRDDPGPAFPESPMPWETEPTGFYQGSSAEGRAGIFSSMRIDGGNVESHLWTSGENVAMFVLPVTTSPSDNPGIWYDIVVVPP